MNSRKQLNCDEFKKLLDDDMFEVLKENLKSIDTKKLERLSSLIFVELYERDLAQGSNL